MPKKVDPRLRKYTPNPFFRTLVINSSKSKGFTFIELLISVSIIAILSVISIGSFQGATNRAAVKNSAQILKADLRKWQNFALSGAKDPAPGGPPGCIDPNTYAYYWVFTSASAGNTSYYRYIVGPNAALCWDLIDQNLPWENQVRVVRVGRSNPAGSDSPCPSVGAKFQPIGEDVQLTCGFPIGGEPTDPVTPLPAGSDRIFIELKHLNDPAPSCAAGAFCYRVYVTAGGIIYDRRMP